MRDLWHFLLWHIMQRIRGQCGKLDKAANEWYMFMSSLQLVPLGLSFFDRYLMFR